MNTSLQFNAVPSARFAQSPVVDIGWLWHGYLASGATTLLTSQWKAGKTTLVSLLLARFAQGGQLAGLPVSRAKAAIVSEERLDDWERRAHALGFGDNLWFFCRPFSARPTHEAWRALIEHLAALRASDGVDLVVIDPLAPFLPGATENHSTSMLDALQPLERLTAAGQSVLLLHHPRKGDTQPGQAARGSGALCASVDIVLEMKLPSNGQPHNRRRRLLAWSRYNETPRDRIIELTTDGRDYVEVLHNPAAQRTQRVLHVVEQLLATPPHMLTRLQILNQWPRHTKPPHPKALWRALDAAVKTGQLHQTGTGLRNDPFRYSFPEISAPWTAVDESATD
jgi:hypothetical protein